MKLSAIALALLAPASASAWQPHGRMSPLRNARPNALAVRGGSMSMAPPAATPAGGFDKCVALGAGKAAQRWVVGETFIDFLLLLASPAGVLGVLESLLAHVQQNHKITTNSLPT